MSHATGLSALLPYVLWGFSAWLASAIFAGYLASQKGRCGWCWFAWGLLYGPLSLIASAGLPPTVQVVRATDPVIRTELG
ncbi:hypothetical protein FXN63_17930 [Pigmentiphaga aceris]|uniref:Uncharacterized protein n=1 Tax=Pigmentiphaga aceris TaxID=1940612 RepID=A0A5C0AYR9_9BURK|nr:hypothetical protein [Pigmentiphaga aceris]QEI07508.1 hypothetical protein FXN63_17930 [Pigmentiphaga aceris]